MNVKATDNLLKFLVLVGAAAYGTVMYQKYRKQEKEVSKKKATDRTEIYSDEVVNIKDFECNLSEERKEELSYLIKIKQLLHNNPNIDVDDLEWDEDYLNLDHHIRISEDDDDRKIKISIELPVETNREYQKVADRIVSDFKEKYNISPHIRKEGYAAILNEEENVIEWRECSGYQSFVDLVNCAKNNDSIKLFYSVSIRKDQSTPQNMMELIESLLNNDEYEEGIQFGPAIFIDKNGEY